MKDKADDKKLIVDDKFNLKDIETTADIALPKDPLSRVIGQDEAIELARIVARQHRHLLLVGPPGTGKSMIAQALALHLPQPKEEVQIVHNPENPERPFVEVKKQAEVKRESAERESTEGELITPKEAPMKIAEQLGYRCPQCGLYSPYTEQLCPSCNNPKQSSIPQKTTGNPFSDLIGIVEVTIGQMNQTKPERVSTTRIINGKEEVVFYERAGDKIKILDEATLEKRREIERQSPMKILVPIDRIPFVMATGASETELLGDVRHDPYGGHPQLGTLPYNRVVAGSIHEAHEGVLYLDELPLLGQLQRNILTAMQEKQFPISGRNPQSAGASVKVENVPCDFIFVGACNIQDLPQILSPLRSRISGDGYEILVETTMEDHDKNRAFLAQFTAQEIAVDGKIPHATRDAVSELIEEAKNRAKRIDEKENALTLRLREMGGVIRIAGDLANLQGSQYIEESHIKKALKRASSIEEQIKNRYGSYYKGLGHDVTTSQRDGASPYNYWDQHAHDDRKGYE
ncbi:MAG: AAA family ATPase [Thermoplasmata archaeon]|nr:MAG: AAA family ATPase [Thermoplasmata archaeon]